MIEVTVFRSGVRDNPVINFIAPIFGMDTADITATAGRSAIPAGADICVLPLTIPDRWIEHQTGSVGPRTTLRHVRGARQQAERRRALPSLPTLRCPWHIDATGYQPVRDKGVRLTLKHNNQDKVAPGMYNAWDLPGSVGGDDYRENIWTATRIS